MKTGLVIAKRQTVLKIFHCENDIDFLCMRHIIMDLLHYLLLFFVVPIKKTSTTLYTRNPTRAVEKRSEKENTKSKNKKKPVLHEIDKFLVVFFSLSRGKKDIS